MTAARTSNLRDLLIIRLKAMAAMQAGLAAGLMNKGQDQLRDHFIDSAKLFAEAAKEFEA